jgi:YVTN family beta-propeller protein
MEMADDVTDQDKAATVSKVEAACAAAISLVIAAKVKTTIAVSISMAIMFAVVVTGEVAIVTPKPPSSSLQCKVSVVYVASQTDGKAYAIATDKNQVVATMPVGRFSWTVAVTPDGTRAYATNWISDTISVVDTVTNSVLTIISLVNGIAPRGLVISPDGTRVYVVHGLNTTRLSVLSTIDTVTNQVISTIQLNVSPGAPYSIVLHPDGTRAYIAGFVPGIVVFDTVKQLVIDVVPPVGLRMLGMAITPDGTQLYLTPEDVSHAHKDGVTVVDTTTDQVKTFIPIPSNLSDSVAVSPDGKRAYTVSYAPMSVVTVIDTAANLALEHIPIPNAGIPMVTVSVDGTQVYVVDGDHTVFVIDAATNKVIGDIVIVGTAHLNAMAAAWIPC